MNRGSQEVLRSDIEEMDKKVKDIEKRIKEKQN